MALGTFTLTGTYQAYGETPASGTVRVDGIPQVVVDPDGNKIKVGPKTVTLDTTGSFSLTLPTDATGGDSATIGYRVTAKLKHQQIEPVEFFAKANGTTLNMADVTPQAVVPLPTEVPVGSLNAFVDQRMTSQHLPNLLSLEELAGHALLPTMSATTEVPIHAALYNSAVQQVSLVFATAVPLSATDYWTVALIRRTSAGTQTTIASKATSGTAITAWVPWTFANLIAPGTGDLVDGDVLTLRFTKSGAAAALTTPAVTFRVPPADSTAPVAPPLSVVFSDDFNRADATSLGNGWVSTSWGITTNAAQSTATPGLAARETGVANCTIDASILAMGSSGTTGIVFRYTDTQNYFGVTDTSVFRRQANVVTTLDSGIAFSPAITINDNARVVLSGSDIGIWIDQGRTGSYTLVKSYSSTFNQTATMHGLRSSATGARIDNFKVSA